MIQPNTDLPSQNTGFGAEDLNEILAWPKDGPAWQRDALRRLYTKGALGDADVDELTGPCEGKGGVALAAEHIPDLKFSARIVNLLAVCDVTNVNSLKKGERLTFDKDGLTVVYGDNNLGKSGYVSILKKVGRARMAPKGDGVLPSIYARKVAG